MNSPHISDISWQLLQQSDQLLPQRALTSHKGDHGFVQIIGGDHGLAGAAVMASQAALVSGAGLVACATRPEHIPAFITRCPEVMAKGVNSGLELAPYLQPNKVQVVGPGLGQRAFGQLLLQTLLQYLENSETSLSMVLDADALNLLAAKPNIIGAAIDFSNHSVIITPHPAEAGRLLNIPTSEVQSDRPKAAKALVEKYACCVILKGHQSLIAGSNAQGEIEIYRCLDGNPGMASGGMGDILSGVVGAVLGQGKNIGLSPLAVAKLACCVHSKAADDASKLGEIGLLATDLLPYIRQNIQSHSQNPKQS
jgi:NAD(P)H-hydrate epimerase